MSRRFGRVGLAVGALVVLGACGEPGDESPRVAFASTVEGLQVVVATCSGERIETVEVGIGNDGWGDAKWIFEPKSPASSGVISSDGSGSLRLMSGSAGSFAKVRSPLFVRVDTESGVDSVAEFSREPPQGSWLRMDLSKDRGALIKTSGPVTPTDLAEIPCAE